MNDLQMKAVLAGVLFGFWPLFMNRSGLGGNVGALAFTLIAGICIMPFAIWSASNSFPSANWTLVVLAGIFGGFGLLVFNSLLTKATPKEVGALFVLMLVTQITAPAVYYVILNGLTVSKSLGFIAVIIATFLLI